MLFIAWRSPNRRWVVVFYLLFCLNIFIKPNNMEARVSTFFKFLGLTLRNWKPIVRIAYGWTTPIIFYSNLQPFIKIIFHGKILTPLDKNVKRGFVKRKDYLVYLSSLIVLANSASSSITTLPPKAAFISSSSRCPSIM